MSNWKFYYVELPFVHSMNVSSLFSIEHVKSDLFSMTYWSDGEGQDETVIWSKKLSKEELKCLCEKPIDIYDCKFSDSAVCWERKPSDS